MKKIDFLPTKFRYNNKNKTIMMYYRLSTNRKLHLAEIPYDHYIYISPEYRKYGNTKEEEQYSLINTNEPLIMAYMNTSEAKNIYKENRFINGEADLSPEQRWVCDTFYNTEFPPSIKPRIFYLDIETFSTDGILPSFEHNVAEINAITIYDSYKELYISWFLLPTKTNDNINEYKNEILNKINEQYTEMKNDIKFFNSPKMLLSSFIKYLIDECPDIITAWNSPFDIPYIIRKIIDHFGLDELKNISPFNRISYKVLNAIEKNEQIRLDSLIPGIDVVDMLELYKQNSNGQRPSYSLNAISEDELGENKLNETDMSKNPNQLYIDNFVNFCRYNIHDVWLIVALEQKLKILELTAIIRNITKSSYQDIFYASRLLDNVFIMEAVKRRVNGGKHVLPSKPLNAAKEQYLGAYVKAPLRGRYEWVADLKQN